MTYGLTPQGFNPKSAATILEEINAAQRAHPDLGADLDNSPGSVVGQLNATVADQLAAQWSALGGVYDGRDPRRAVSAALDTVASLLVLPRRAAQRGAVNVSLRLAPGARIPAGVIVHVAGDPTNRWVTREAASNTSSGTVSRVVAAESESAGPFAADARTLTVVATPMTGLLGASNDDDALEGAADESDRALRARLAAYTSGNATVRALLRVPRVRNVALEENASDRNETGAGGLPAHSVRAFVVGGDDQAIAEALAAATAGGIATQGETERTVNGRSIRFARPAEAELYARVTLEVDPETYAGDAAVRRAVAALDDELVMGVAPSRSTVLLAARSVAGVIDCTDVLMGRSAQSLAPANVIVQPRELARVGPSRVIVVARGA